MDIVFTDRYGPAGPPSLLRACLGQCEATGYVPVYRRPEGMPPSDWNVTLKEDDPELIRRWEEAEATEPTDDGWHFVPCPDCEGTGRSTRWLTTRRNLRRWLSTQLNFAKNHLLVWPYRASTARAWQEESRETLFQSTEPTGRLPRWSYDVLSVRWPWLRNRFIVLQVIFGMTADQRNARRYRRAQQRAS